MKNNLSNETPWHSEPYVWLVIALPLTAVIGGIITIWLAVQSDDGLVVDDYYKKGLEINRTLQRDNAAKNYGIDANIDIDQKSGMLTIELVANEEFEFPPQLEIKLMHATRKVYDQDMIINRIAPKKYQASIPELTRGTWYVQIEKEDWRIVKTFHIN